RAGSRSGREQSATPYNLDAVHRWPAAPPPHAVAAKQLGFVVQVSPQPHSAVGPSEFVMKKAPNSCLRLVFCGRVLHSISCETVGATVVEVPRGHPIFISNPEAVATLIEHAASSVK